MVVCACVVSSLFDEAGVSSAVMSAPWSLDSEHRGTRPAAQLLLPLSYATVGWGRGAVFRGGQLFLARCSFGYSAVSADVGMTRGLS